MYQDKLHARVVVDVLLRTKTRRDPRAFRRSAGKCPLTAVFALTRFSLFRIIHEATHCSAPALADGRHEPQPILSTAHLDRLRTGYSLFQSWIRQFLGTKLEQVNPELHVAHEWLFWTCR